MSLQKIKDQIDKELKVSGFFLNEKPEQIPVISTGQKQLDEALGINGFPRGRMIEIFGGESSGKSTLALHVVAEAQKIGGTAVYIDMENALDRKYSRAIGVIEDDTFIIYQPDDGEQGLAIVEAYVGKVDIIVVDSVATLIPRAELEGEMGDKHVGLHARLMSQACRKLNAKIKETNTILIWINQTRTNIGQMFGDPTVTTGGNALKFYSSVRLQLYPKFEKPGSLEKEVTVRVRKNKLAPPATECDLTVVYGVGFDPIPYIVDQAKKKEIIVSPHYTYGEEKIATNRNDAIQYVRDHPEFLEILKEKLNAPSR